MAANFHPAEIIRVDKIGGQTKVTQAVELDEMHFRRFINQDNAELFFSDRVVLVEGSTEKHLFKNLDKFTPIAEDDDNNCDFDKANIGIIELDSVDSIVNYFKIARAFNIPVKAVVDKDFLSSEKQGICSKLCDLLNIDLANSDTSLASSLKEKGVLVNPKGEIEDLFPEEDIADLVSVSVEMVREKKRNNDKTSKAFQKLFGCGKVEYALRLVDYYQSRGGGHPLTSLIQGLFMNNLDEIVF